MTVHVSSDLVELIFNDQGQMTRKSDGTIVTRVDSEGPPLMIGGLPDMDNAPDIDDETLLYIDLARPKGANSFCRGEGGPDLAAGYIGGDDSSHYGTPVQYYKIKSSR